MAQRVTGMVLRRWWRGVTLLSLLVGACRHATVAEVEATLRAEPGDYVFDAGGALVLTTLVLENRGRRDVSLAACLGFPQGTLQRVVDGAWVEWDRLVSPCDGVVTVAPGDRATLHTPLPPIGQYRLVIELDGGASRRQRLTSSVFRVRGG